MDREFEVTLRRDDGGILTRVTLLPDSPDKRRVAASDYLADSEREGAFASLGVMNVGEYFIKTIPFLIDDVLECDSGGMAALDWPQKPD